MDTSQNLKSLQESLPPHGWQALEYISFHPAAPDLAKETMRRDEKAPVRMSIAAGEQ